MQKTMIVNGRKNVYIPLFVVYDFCQYTVPSLKSNDTNFGPNLSKMQNFDICVTMNEIAKIIYF